MNFIMISGTLSHDYIKWLFPPRRFLTRCSRKYFDGKFVMDPRNSRRKLVTQSLHIVLSVHVCVLPRKHAHTWPSRNWHVHIGEYYEAQSPLLYIPDACKDLCLSCPCVCVCVRVRALYKEQEGCVAHTPSRRQSLWPVNTLSAPATPDTLDCTRSPLPTSSHFTQPGLYSSKAKRYRHRCVRPLLRTHTHTASASRRITSRSEGGTTETNHRRCGRHSARRAMGSE